MDQDALSGIFDETHLTDDERAFLDYQDFRMRSVGQQFKLEVGRILSETRDWFRSKHRRGFEEWASKKWGISRQYQQYLMDAFKQLNDQNFSQLGISLSAQLELKKSPNQQFAIDEVRLRQELEERITAKKAKEIADLQHAKKIADDERKSAQERAIAIDQQLSYVKRQLDQAVAAKESIAAKKTIEKKVEVTPPHVLERQRQLEERIRELSTLKTQLQAQTEQLKRERDLYKRDLDKERQSGNALFLQNLEANGTARKHANFAETMREIVAWSRAAEMKLPSIVDTQTFEAEEWQRLEEAIQAIEVLGQDLRKIRNTVSSSMAQQSFIVDSAVVDTNLAMR